MFNGPSLDPRNLPDVSSKYGAPMGRPSDRTPPEVGDDWTPEELASLSADIVTFEDGCYDTGGAYWGSPANLFLIQWCDGDTGEWKSTYKRFDSVTDLMVELEIPKE